jgi:hypothetical protein
MAQNASLVQPDEACDVHGGRQVQKLIGVRRSAIAACISRTVPCLRGCVASESHHPVLSAAVQVLVLLQPSPSL